MRVCENGAYRDATPEEIESINNTPAPGTEDELTADEIVQAIEEVLA